MLWSGKPGKSEVFTKALRKLMAIREYQSVARCTAHPLGIPNGHFSSACGVRRDKPHANNRHIGVMLAQSLPSRAVILMTIPMELQHASKDFDRFLTDARGISGLATRHQTYTIVQGVFQVFRRRLDLSDAALR